MTGMVYLIGMRGSGKTTVGRLLARRLATPFFDADEVLEAQAGMSIRAMIAERGEPVFRDFEERILKELASRGPAVVATGGGVILRDSNRQLMKETGRVVWLNADIDTLWQRQQADDLTTTRRPDLAMGGRAEVEHLLRTRIDLYRQTASVEVNSAGRSPEQIVEDILDA